MPSVWPAVPPAGCAVKTIWLAVAGVTAIPVSLPVMVVVLRGRHALRACRFQRDVEGAGAASDGDVAGSTAWGSLLVIWTVPE